MGSKRGAWGVDETSGCWQREFFAKLLVAVVVDPAVVGRVFTMFGGIIPRGGKSSGSKSSWGIGIEYCLLIACILTFCASTWLSSQAR